MTLPLGQLARLVDGHVNAAELIATLPACEPGTLIQALAWLEQQGFIAADWHSGRSPLRWHDDGQTAGEARLLSLLESHLEALFDVSVQLDGPLPVFAGFLHPRETAAAGTQDGVEVSWRRGGTKRDIVSGRGATKRQAVLSCLGEAAERLSAGFRGDEPLRRASFASLGETAVHPDRLLNFSARQYATRDAWNAGEPGDSWVPYPFAEDQDVTWVAARPLAGGPERLVPAAFVYFDYSGEPAATCFCRANSNGCASAPTIEQAIERGFLELVERDAVAIWWYNRIPRPALSPEALGQPAIGAVAAWQAGRGRALHLLDLTSDLGISVCAAVTHDEDGGRIVFGFGAGWQTESAGLAAVTEMQQVYLSALLVEEAQAAGTAASPSAAAGALHGWLSSAGITAHPNLLPRSGGAVPAAADNTGAPLDRIAALCNRAGLEPLAIDLTRADIGVPTARVIVPGLRHFWARFGPGRLYDVPVALGWRPTACAESELNPTPMFI